MVFPVAVLSKICRRQKRGAWYLYFLPGCGRDARLCQAGPKKLHLKNGDMATNLIARPCLPGLPSYPSCHCPLYIVGPGMTDSRRRCVGPGAQKRAQNRACCPGWRRPGTIAVVSHSKDAALVSEAPRRSAEHLPRAPCVKVGLGSPEWRSFWEKLEISQCLNVGQNTYFKHSGRTMPIHPGN